MKVITRTSSEPARCRIQTTSKAGTDIFHGRCLHIYYVLSSLHLSETANCFTPKEAAALYPTMHCAFSRASVQIHTADFPNLFHVALGAALLLTKTMIQKESPYFINGCKHLTRTKIHLLVRSFCYSFVMFCSVADLGFHSLLLVSNLRNIFFIILYINNNITVSNSTILISR